MPLIGPFPPLSADVRARSLDEALSNRQGGSPMRIFAYGALIWRRPFTPHAEMPGLLSEHARRFSIWTASARGTPDRPGLGLALEQIVCATCQGVLFELQEATLLDDLKALWEREMWTGIYRPIWVTVHTREGAMDALTFVVNVGHPQYAGVKSLDVQMQLIARASGELGTCYDYLASTVEALQGRGCVDDYLESLLRRTTAYLDGRTG